MSKSRGRAGSRQQPRISIQDMVANIKLSASDVEALGRARIERLGEGGFGEASLVANGKFKVIMC